jgi:hypothetical protein
MLWIFVDSKMSGTIILCRRVVRLLLPKGPMRTIDVWETQTPEYQPTYAGPACPQKATRGGDAAAALS